MLCWLCFKSKSFIQLKRVRQSWGEQGGSDERERSRALYISALLQGGIEGLGVTGVILCSFDFSKTRLLWAGQPWTLDLGPLPSRVSAGVTGVTHHAACHSEGW